MPGCTKGPTKSAPMWRSWWGTCPAPSLWHISGRFAPGGLPAFEPPVAAEVARADNAAPAVRQHAGVGHHPVGIDDAGEKDGQTVGEAQARHPAAADRRDESVV